MEQRVMMNRSELPALITMGVFKPAQPWIHVDRILNMDTLLYVVDGEVTVCEEEIDYTLSSGQAFFLKNQCRHWGKSPVAPGSTWYWVSFVPFQPRAEQEPLFLPKQLTLSSPESFMDILNAMLRLYRSAAPFSTERMNGLLYQALYELLQQDLQQREKHRGSALSSRIIACLKQQLEQPFDSKRIADRLSMNYTYLGRVFKADTGSTINEYYRKLKIQRAIELMHAEALNLSQISEQLQFPNPYYFSRVFKQVTGLSPRDYQQQLYR
ncbi:helix-turn-helix domain-containing protein [Paenibacillus sp. JSM ZJ436]|uniref:Transcriptional regulator n=1 Tax=Paenibacillus algicola TaxID=2565926 RepID=A0A4P8XHQ6_9BACL|nr:AraC family transcriptional regulator [Paenibacillus algicola]QCT00970.1 transcriptional regulator [Paenibacillus algicola]